MTVGLKAVRELSLRCPLVMTEELLQVRVEVLFVVILAPSVGEHLLLVMEGLFFRLRDGEGALNSAWQALWQLTVMPSDDS
jgi:hypothetical protein